MGEIYKAMWFLIIPNEKFLNSMLTFLTSITRVNMLCLLKENETNPFQMRFLLPPLTAVGN